MSANLGINFFNTTVKYKEQSTGAKREFDMPKGSQIIFKDYNKTISKYDVDNTFGSKEIGKGGKLPAWADAVLVKTKNAYQVPKEGLSPEQYEELQAKEDAQLNKNDIKTLKGFSAEELKEFYNVQLSNQGSEYKVPDGGNVHLFENSVEVQMQGANSKSDENWRSVDINLPK